ncbi:MAG: ankyrin repeat domain-containing protein [Archangium sp.]|nr:ankyrin repeat domain-containing protein [Archangium sp.]
MSWEEFSRAAGKNDLAALKRMLEARAPTPKELREALAFAVIHSHADTIRWLVERGADPNALEGTSGPALHFANKTSIAKLLLSLGADPRVRDSAGCDAVHAHLRSNGPGSRRDSDVELVRACLDAGVDVRARNGDLPHLLMACAAGNLKIIELLIERGADPDARDSHNESIYSRSTGSGDKPAVLATIARLGLPPNTTWDYAGDKTSILMELCRAGDLETVEFLLKNGADPNLSGTMTPLALAEASGNAALVDLLLEKGARSPKRVVSAEQLAALEAHERRARQDPTSAALRLENAAVLARSAYFAAAACETFEARRLLRTDAGELPSGHSGWTITAAPLPKGAQLAPRVEDGRFPGALATDGKTVTPLVMLFGAPCTKCDEKGETVCVMCDGTGSYVPQFSDDEIGCDPRQVCSHCFGTKFEVQSARHVAKGSCKHEKVVSEFTFISRHRLVRCERCALPGVQLQYTRFACADCSKFVCSCKTVSR